MIKIRFEKSKMWVGKETGIRKCVHESRRVHNSLGRTVWKKVELFQLLLPYDISWLTMLLPTLALYTLA